MLLITVAEAKAQCRIEPDEVDEDALLTGLIEAAIS
ncbi:MAG: head-tail connector protein, partial [Aeromonas sp.]